MKTCLYLYYFFPFLYEFSFSFFLGGKGVRLLFHPRGLLPCRGKQQPKQSWLNGVGGRMFRRDCGITSAWARAKTAPPG